MSHDVLRFRSNLANHTQCVSECITQAAMLSPPVLHFVILPLGSCSPACIEVLPNSLWLFIKTEKNNNYIAFIWFSDVHSFFFKRLFRLLFYHWDRLLLTFYLKVSSFKTEVCQLLQQHESCLKRQNSSEEGPCLLWECLPLKTICPCNQQHPC